MAEKKKIATAAVAVTAAAALLLGGTFAWQSISQTALNEASDIVNPGGRLHDDFNGENKDVYVENFAEEDIFARIRLEEYFEIVLNAGTNGEKTVPVIGEKTEQTDEAGNTVYDYTYVTYLFDGHEKTDENGEGTGAYKAGIDEDDTSWWSWDMGGSTVFMPTFNKNKDSLKADINGEYRFETGMITDKDVEGGQYSDMVTYDVDELKTANAIYDIDSNTADEIAQEDLAALIGGTSNADAYSDNVKLLNEEHAAKNTGYGELISMADWLALIGYDEDGNYVYNPEMQADYWVYDTDGWVYWSSPIPAGEATGLLLNGIELNQVMDDSWYYAINVVAQFCTAGDMGTAPEYDEEGELVTPGTGFYADGETVSGEAWTLLDLIGVNDTTSSDGNEEPEGPYDPNGNLYDIHLYALDEDALGDASYLAPNVEYKLLAVVATNEQGESNPVVAGWEEEGYDVDFSVSIGDRELTEGEDYTLTQDEEVGFVPVKVIDSDTNEEKTEYQATATLKILKEDLLGEWMTVTVTAPHSSTENQYVIQYDNIEMTVQLYKEDTDEEVTGYIIQPGTTYDVVVTAHIGNMDIGDLVIYDTRDNNNVATNINLVTGDDDMLSVYDIGGGSDINESGQLVSGPKPGVNDGMNVSATVNDLQVLGENDEIIYRAYASGYTEWLYGSDMVQLIIDIPSQNFTAEEAKTFGVHLKAGIPTAANIPDVTFDVTGNTDPRTQVKTGTAGEPTDQWLILGAYETAGEITVVAKKDGYLVSESFTFTVDYRQDITALACTVPEGWNYNLAPGDSVTVTVRGSYLEDDLIWSVAPGDEQHIVIDDHGDGTATLTHAHTEEECSGGSATVTVSLTEKSEIYKDIVITCSPDTN